MTPTREELDRAGPCWSISSTTTPPPATQPPGGWRDHPTPATGSLVGNGSRSAASRNFLRSEWTTIMTQNRPTPPCSTFREFRGAAPQRDRKPGTAVIPVLNAAFVAYIVGGLIAWLAS